MQEPFVKSSKHWAKYLLDLQSEAGSARCDCSGMLKNFFEQEKKKKEKKKKEQEKYWDGDS